MFSDARSRTRLGLLALLCVASVLTVGLTVPAGADGPTTTTRLGPVLTKDENPVQTSGRDVGFSVPLPNGQALWIFGDTTTIQYSGNAWKITHFIAGSSAGIGPYTPGHVPAPMTQVIVGKPHRPDNQAARFVPAPSNIVIPDGSGRACNQANGASELGARWVTGAALLPDATNVLITYIGVCVMSPTSISVQSYGFMQYDWVHNKITVRPVDVFPATPNGATLDRVKMFGSPVIANNHVTLFSQTCCEAPADFYATTIPATVAALSNPASYTTRSIPSLHPAVSGLMDATIGAYPDGRLRLVAIRDQQGGYELWSAPAADGPWTRSATGTLPGCADNPDYCYGIIGHPELTTASSLFVSYYLRNSGPGVPGHPYPHRPLNHVTMAAVATGPGPAPDAAPVPKGAVPSKPTSPKAGSKPTSKATGPMAVSYRGGSNNGSVVLRYTATCASSDGGATRTAAHAGANVVPITVTGLTTKKRYTCSVRATNGWGTGAPSVASAPVVVGAPNAPTKVRAAKAAAGQLNVTFASGANNGGAITRYTVTCTSTNGGAKRAGAGTNHTLAVTKLTKGKAYTCAVTATNSRGTGPPSAPSPAKTA